MKKVTLLTTEPLSQKASETLPANILVSYPIPIELLITWFNPLTSFNLKWQDGANIENV